MAKQLTITNLNNLAKTILNEIDKRDFATKKDLENYATKDDLKNLANKEDLRKFATKDDVKKIVNDALHIQLAEFNISIIKPQFDDLEQKLSNKIDNSSKDFIKKKDLQKLYA